MKREYHSRVEKNRHKRNRIFLPINIILILIILGISLIILKMFDSIKVEEEKRSVDEEKTPVEVNREFSLVAVGDALIHDGVYKDAKTNKKGEDGYFVYSFSKMFSDIKEVIKDFDLKFYNQETIIGGEKIGLSSYPTFNSPDEIGKDMVSAGFNLVNLATNHTLDRGEKAVLYSRSFWNNQNAYAVGSYESQESRDKIVVRQQNGISYTLLGYTTSTNGIKVPENKEYLVNVYEKEQVKKDIEKVRDKVDVIIVSMHWGTEYTHTPTASQKEIAQYLASLGVDVIIGHHPHVIQPIEYIDNTLVIYSLGNFISAQDGTNKRVGMIASFNVHKKTIGTESTITIDTVQGDLLWTYHRRYRDFKVIPFSKLNNNQLKGHQNIYKEYISIINKTNDSRITTGWIK